MCYAWVAALCVLSEPPGRRWKTWQDAPLTWLSAASFLCRTHTYTHTLSYALTVSVLCHCCAAGSVVSIAAGGNHSLALTRDGTVFQWGQRTFLQPSPVEYGYLKPSADDGDLNIDKDKNSGLRLRGIGVRCSTHKHCALLWVVLEELHCMHRPCVCSPLLPHVLVFAFADCCGRRRVGGHSREWRPVHLGQELEHGNAGTHIVRDGNTTTRPRGGLARFAIVLCQLRFQACRSCGGPHSTTGAVKMSSEPH